MIKIGACDDEARELKQIETLIGKWAQTHHMPVDIRCFDNGEALLAAIKGGEAFDILFLDIYMGEKDGIAVAREIRKIDTGCAIVFATNSRERAIDGFAVHALHYLLKPIDDQSLADALDRAMQTQAKPRDKLIQIVSRQKQYCVEIGDIRFAESSARVVTVHTRESGNICYYDKLDNFELLCDDERFVRCHKSFLVNLDYVQAIVATVITLDSGEEIPISKNTHEIKARFASYVAQRI